MRPATFNAYWLPPTNLQATPHPSLSQKPQLTTITIIRLNFYQFSSPELVSFDLDQKSRTVHP